MTSEELNLADLTTQQYKALLVMQGKAYKKILNLYKECINDSEKIKMLNQDIAIIDATIITELENIKKHSRLEISKL